MKLSDLYYYPLKLYVVISCFLYFRKLRVTGLKNIPAKGPLIYAINHQNALLDPLVVHSVSWRNPYFLTRADIFNNKFVDQFLRGIKMLPIYRIRDGFDSIKMNEAVFESAKEILTKGGVVGIFPEGSHSLLYKMRPLKKGVARIAFMTEEAADFKLNVQIIPIGIHYESHSSTKGRTLVTYGKPINVADYKQTYQQDQNKAFNELLTEISDRVKLLILNIESKDYDRAYEAYKNKRVFKINLKKQLKADQALVDSIEHGGKFEETSDKKNLLLQALENSIRMLWNITHFIPKSIIDLIVKKKVKDPHFYGTMQLAYSMILYPIFFLILYFLIKFFVF
ncbi:MAG: 1-acyl-sn-glycerol-3-phosphate acyltransferase [Cyclobacteriaceae bacterium]|nr:1-acyl-sn-glycerol-3-phosphate acyltransferase [Cyclobacteriaceae bacterium]